jgi:hypothetical protein
MGSSFQTIGTRGRVLFCFYTIVLASLPFWYKTTTIERLALPVSEVNDWESRLPCPVRLRQTLTLRLPPDVLTRKDEAEVARQLARGLNAAGDGVWAERDTNARLLQNGTIDQAHTSERPSLALEHAACIDWTIRLSESAPLLPSSLHYIISVSNGEASDFFLSTSTTRRFGLNLDDDLIGRTPTDLAWLLSSRLSSILQLPYRDLFFQGALPTLGESAAASKGAPQSSGDRSMLRSIERIETDKRQIPYTHNVRLVFSLINEDVAVQGDPPSISGILGWDTSETRKAFTRRIAPVIDAVQGVHHIVSEMQTIWFAPLSFETKEIDLSPFEGEQQKQHLIRTDDLQIFVDAGEWGLSSGGSPSTRPLQVEQRSQSSATLQSSLRSLSQDKERTLHFVLYVPRASRRPMRIAEDEQATRASDSTSWLIPQWGGVALHNLEDVGIGEGLHEHKLGSKNLVDHLNAQQLDNAFASFGKQLAILLGVRPTPSSAFTAHFPSREAKLAVALDALTRRRICESLRESVRTLASIVRLVDKIKILGVGKEVQDDVDQAIAMLESVAYTSEHGDAYVSQGSPTSALPFPLSPLIRLMEVAYGAEMLSARAFFNPHMLAQLYFPDEHKYAVYTPLFGPLAMPFLVAAIRLIRERRADRLK